jgi:hypothetical protein
VKAKTWSPNDEEQERLLPKRIQLKLNRESTNNKKGEDNKKCETQGRWRRRCDPLMTRNKSTSCPRGSNIDLRENLHRFEETLEDSLTKKASLGDAGTLIER